MNDKINLLNNLDKLHTTDLGVLRIIKNLNLYSEEPVPYCISIIKKTKCSINTEGKNVYCQYNNIRITINSSSYTIITAHII